MIFGSEGVLKFDECILGLSLGGWMEYVGLGLVICKIDLRLMENICKIKIESAHCYFFTFLHRYKIQRH
jgi:hypothetical protein